MANNRWLHIGRSDLVALGKDLVTERLERFNCVVARARNPMDGRLEVRTADHRSVEVFVSTQRVGGYAFWTKRRLQPRSDRFAAVVLLGDDPEPALYLVPSTDWLDPSPPLTDRDYEGKASDPEFGIELSQSSLDSLRRYIWTEGATRSHFRQSVRQ